jgi:hypothetical protein
MAFKRCVSRYYFEFYRVSVFNQTSPCTQHLILSKLSHRCQITDGIDTVSTHCRCWHDLLTVIIDTSDKRVVIVIGTSDKCLLGLLIQATEKKLIHERNLLLEIF